MHLQKSSMLVQPNFIKCLVANVNTIIEEEIFSEQNTKAFCVVFQCLFQHMICH